jgi:hypothetical protein
MPEWNLDVVVAIALPLHRENTSTNNIGDVHRNYFDTTWNDRKNLDEPIFRSV